MLALNDQVSLLLKDSFIDSFPSNDRPFIKVLVLFFLHWRCVYFL
jgi:hypothetical protein